MNALLTAVIVIFFVSTFGAVGWHWREKLFSCTKRAKLGEEQEQDIEMQRQAISAPVQQQPQIHPQMQQQQQGYTMGVPHSQMQQGPYMMGAQPLMHPGINTQFAQPPQQAYVSPMPSTSAYQQPPPQHQQQQSSYRPQQPPQPYSQQNAGMSSITRANEEWQAARPVAPKKKVVAEKKDTDDFDEISLDDIPVAKPKTKKKMDTDSDSFNEFSLDKIPLAKPKKKKTAPGLNTMVR